MKPTCLVLLNPSTHSLDFQHELLVNQTKWSNEFKVYFAYIVPELSMNYLQPAAANTSNNQYSNLDIVDKVHTDCLDIDSAKLYTTKILLSASKIPVLMIDNQTDLLNKTNGYDLVVFHHRSIDGDLWQLLFKQLVVRSSPIMLTNKIDNERVQDIYFLFNGSEQNIQSLKYFTYLFDKKLMQYHFHLITIVNEDTIAKEKILYDYVKGKFHKVSVERIYEDDSPAYFTKILSMGNHTTIITNKQHTDFLTNYNNNSIIFDQRLANIFISQ
jgi:hypothetical protein